MAVEFRYAHADEYPLVSQFINDNWAKDHIYCRSQPLFDWTFRRPGFWKDDGYCVAVAFDGPELVGILGGIEFTFNRFGQPEPGVWIANYVVREDHRRGATALKLLSMLRRPPYKATIAFGINPATANIYKVLRGDVLPLIPRHVIVLPGQQDRLLNLLKIAHSDWPEDKARGLAGHFEVDSLPECDVQTGDRVPDDWDEHNWNAIASSTIGCARNADFLRWRYSDHPLFDYRVITVPNGKRTGLAVWRKEMIRRQTDEGRADVDTIGRLVEFIPASPENANDLGAAFLNALAAEDIMGADFYGYHGESRSQLKSLGFTLTDTHADGEGIPSRFQPLDGKGGGIMSATFVQGEAPKCTVEADCPWLWTKSDSDQDRPN